MTSKRTLVNPKTVVMTDDGKRYGLGMQFWATPQEVERLGEQVEEVKDSDAKPPKEDPSPYPFVGGPTETVTETNAPRVAAKKSHKRY